MDSSRNTHKNSSPSSTLTKRKQQNDIQTTAATTTLRYLGVRQHPSGRYVARISIQSMRKRQWYRIGTFDTAEEAALAYDRSARSLPGVKARTNFIYADMPPGSSITSIISPDDHQTEQINNPLLAPPPPPDLLDLIFYSDNDGGGGGDENVQMMMPSDDVELPPLPSDITTSNYYLDNNGFGNETEFLGSSDVSTNQLDQNINRFSSVPDNFFDGVEEEMVKFMKSFNLTLNP